MGRFCHRDGGVAGGFEGIIRQDFEQLLTFAASRKDYGDITVWG
jgi:hypothetical protein